MVKPLQIRPTPEEIYLDCNATTPVLADIAAAVRHVMEDVFGNPSSSHITGLKARYILDQTRRLGRQVIGASRGDLIFTSGATEGIQTAVLSALSSAKNASSASGRYLLYGATEHKAVPQALAHWNEVLGLGAELKAIPVDTGGLLDKEFIASHVADAVMICTMAANNETGVRQDLLALEQVIRQHNSAVPWLVDCVQALGKLPLALDDISIDYAPFSGHKLYAPKGIGFLYIRQGAPFTSLIIGGGQESGLRSGTENLPGIAALNALFELLLDENQTTFQLLSVLEGYRDQLQQALREAFPTIEFNHDFTHSVPTTLNFSVRGVSSRDIMDVFDAANIRVSSGSACSSKVTRSFVLDAMGLESWRSESAVRLSYGPATSSTLIDDACERIRGAAQALRRSCLLLADTQEDIDSRLDGVVQLRYGEHCSYLLIDKAACELAVIDPRPELAPRIDNLIRCQNYRVRAVLTTEPQSNDDAASWLAQVWCASGCDTERDQVGWPSHSVGSCDTPNECTVQVHGCLTVGRRRLYRVGTRSPIYLLSSPLQDVDKPAQVDFAFVGSQPNPTWLDQAVVERTLLCPSIDAEQHLALRLCELTGGCAQASDIDLGIDEERVALNDPQQLIIDVREQHEHDVKQLPVKAEVLNVPLTRALQFIYEHRDEWADKPMLCICRSGNRSATVAQALRRHGFKHVKHVSGGLAFL